MSDNNINKSENPIDQNFWNERWQKSETGWDIGQASPAITDYIYRNTQIKMQPFLSQDAEMLMKPKF